MISNSLAIATANFNGDDVMDGLMVGQTLGKLCRMAAALYGSMLMPLALAIK